MTREEGFQIMCSASEKDLADALSRMMGERRILASQACSVFSDVLKHRQQGDHHAPDPHHHRSRVSRRRSHHG